jgi:hypothetical protein
MSRENTSGLLGKNLTLDEAQKLKAEFMAVPVKIRTKYRISTGNPGRVNKTVTGARIRARGPRKGKHTWLRDLPIEHGTHFSVYEQDRHYYDVPLQEVPKDILKELGYI